MENKLRFERNRLQVIEGLIIVIKNHEIAGEILADKKSALKNLMDKLPLSKLQAQAIIDLRKSPDQIQIGKAIEEQERLKKNIEQLEKDFSEKNKKNT